MQASNVVAAKQLPSMVEVYTGGAFGLLVAAGCYAAMAGGCFGVVKLIGWLT